MNVVRGWDGIPREAVAAPGSLEVAKARLGELRVSRQEKRRLQGDSEPLPGPKRAPGELERDWGQGMEGQDTGNGFPLPEGRADQRSGINSSL